MIATHKTQSKMVVTNRNGGCWCERLSRCGIEDVRKCGLRCEEKRLGSAHNEICGSAAWHLWSGKLRPNTTRNEYLPRRSQHLPFNCNSQPRRQVSSNSSVAMGHSRGLRSGTRYAYSRSHRQKVRNINGRKIGTEPKTNSMNRA